MKRYQIIEKRFKIIYKRYQMVDHIMPRDWFKELYPEVPPEFPPSLRLRQGKTYKVTFKEGRPRLVVGGFNRPTAVINVEYEGESRSLFVGSNVDLGRQISAIEKRRGSLERLCVEITKIEKRGKNWMYKVVEVET